MIWRKPQEVARPLRVKLLNNRIKCTFRTVPMGCSQQLTLSSCSLLHLMQDLACRNFVMALGFLMRDSLRLLRSFVKTSC